MRQSTGKLVAYWFVVVDSSGPSGRDDMGTVIYRFKKESQAQAWASGRKCFGQPATVQRDECPKRLALRWGLL